MLHDGASKLLGTVYVDQTKAPSGTTVNGVTYQSLGVFRITYGTIQVVLSNDANNYVVADAVRIAPTATVPTNVDNDDPGYSSAGGWTTVPFRGGVNNDYQYAAPSGSAATTATATWSTTGLAPGAYNLQATWVPYSNRADNAPYRIYDGNALRATVRVNQQIAPSGGTTINGVTYQNLGSYPVYSGTLRVVLGNDADGFVIADSSYVSAATIPAVVDNGDPNYAEAGTWSTAGGGGVNGSYRFAAAGTGASTATWQIAIPGPGSYDVEVTWVPYSNRASNARYRVTTNAGQTITTVLVDQRQAPSGVTAGGVTYQSLGVFNNVVGGNIQITLDNNADGFVIADAVRVVPTSGNTSTIP